MTPGEGHAVACALVGRGSRGSGGIPYVGGRSTYGAREPVLRNAAAAGSHPDVCASAPLVRVPRAAGAGRTGGRAGWCWTGGGGRRGRRARARRAAGLPGPVAVRRSPLPLLVWLFGFGWFVEPLFWLPELLFPALFPELFPGCCPCRRWLAGARWACPGCPSWAGRWACRETGSACRSASADRSGRRSRWRSGRRRRPGSRARGRRRCRGTSRRGAVGGLEGLAEALEAGRRGGRTVGGRGRGLGRWTRTEWRTGTRATPSSWRSRSTRRRWASRWPTRRGSVRAAAGHPG